MNIPNTCKRFIPKIKEIKKEKSRCHVI